MQGWIWWVDNCWHIPAFLGNCGAKGWEPLELAADRCARTDRQHQGGFNHGRLPVPWVLTVTQMCPQEIFISTLSGEHCPLCRGRGIYWLFFPPWTGRKRKEEMLSVSDLFLYLTSWVLTFCPPSASHCVPSVRSCPRWEVPLLGRSQRCCIQTLLRGGQQKGKKISSPRTL